MATGPVITSYSIHYTKLYDLKIASAAVGRVLEQRGVLICEAGTGTGKTFAYLVPSYNFV